MAPKAPRSRRRALVTLGFAALALTVGVATAAPAGAAWWWRPTTTTTKAPTTTTTKPTTTTTAVPTPVPAPATPCGGPLPKGDGTSWTCTFSDEFVGTTLDRTKWYPQVTATSNVHGGGACFVDDPDNVSVAGGTLRLTVRKESSSFTCAAPNNPFRTSYTTGQVSTFQRFSQTYGRFEVRAKFPHVVTKGLQEAIWLWPDDATKYGAWPLSGEIDIAEVYHQHADRAIPYIHYAPDPWYDPTVTNNYCLVDKVWNFHTYVAEWTEDRIRISFDGEVCVDHEINAASPLAGSQPFDHPFMIAITQALGVGDNAFAPWTTPIPATTEVDYVRVWK